MRLLEFASADDLLKLWQIVSQNVFAAVEKERREAEEAQRIEASKPKRSRAVRSPSRSLPIPKTVRPKAVKPRTVTPQVPKTQAVAVKPSSANMPLQTMAQKPFQKPFQQPNQNSVQKFFPQVPNRVVTTRKQINQQRPISS
ncbi:MAG: hypothetical protein NT095_02260 [Burkholderiales bacterium]|nr:hypothetical protein [Burkholderiales bacterium]